MILEGKVAIVTGAGQGIGRGIALALAKEGANIAIPEINLENAIAVANEIKEFGRKALPIACDVGKREEVNAAVSAVVQEFGTVDILVNNAQAARSNVNIEDETDDGWNTTFQSGVNGTFYFMQACFPYLKEKGGKIINFASTAGTNGLEGMCAYAANKEAIRGLSRVAANEWGKYKINVNVVLPWATSRLWEYFEQNNPDVAKVTLEQNPMRRIGDPEEDVGRVVVFLAGPDSDYVNGVNIPVDGGQTILR